MIEPKGSIYITTRELKYRDVVVPVGTPTDGLTLKIRFLHLFISKYDPRVIEAVIMHDYLCEKELYAKADKYFEEMLPDIWQKKPMVAMVKIYHKLKYKA